MPEILGGGNSEGTYHVSREREEVDGSTAVWNGVIRGE
jgi:hypothetical protein